MYATCPAVHPLAILEAPDSHLNWVREEQRHGFMQAILQTTIPADQVGTIYRQLAAFLASHYCIFPLRQICSRSSLSKAEQRGRTVPHEICIRLRVCVTDTEGIAMVWYDMIYAIAMPQAMSKHRREPRGVLDPGLDSAPSRYLIGPRTRFHLLSRFCSLDLRSFAITVQSQH